MRFQDNIKTVGDLFNLLETMEFFAGDIPLNKSDAYLAIKGYCKRYMNDPVPSEYTTDTAVTGQKETLNEEPHFQKRDLNEAEEY